MKNFFFLVISALITFSCLAQSPEKISYQAVIRNSNGDLVVNSAIGMRLSILKNSASGSAVYIETQTTNTNSNGLATIEIGNGTVISGSFSAIAWGNGTYFIKTETDPTGGTTYSITGSSQLLSVPYALYARDVDNNDDADPNPFNELQALSISNDTVYLSNGGQVKLPPEVDGSVSNELQVLSISTDTIFLSNGGFVVLPPEIDGSVLNELQILSLSNDTLYIQNGNYVFLGNLKDDHWIRSGNYVSNVSDSIGIGTSSPSSKLDVNGGIKSSMWNVSEPIPYGSGIHNRSGSFTSNGGTLLVSVSGSAYATPTQGMLSLNVLIGSTVVGNIKIWANQVSVHTTFVPATFIVTGISAGSHSISLNLVSGSSDGNDQSQVIVTELPF